MSAHVKNRNTMQRCKTMSQASRLLPTGLTAKVKKLCFFNSQCSQSAWIRCFFWSLVAEKYRDLVNVMVTQKKSKNLLKQSWDKMEICNKYLFGGVCVNEYQMNIHPYIRACMCIYIYIHINARIYLRVYLHVTSTK